MPQVLPFRLREVQVPSTPQDPFGEIRRGFGYLRYELDTFFGLRCSLGAHASFSGASWSSTKRAWFSTTMAPSRGRRKAHRPAFGTAATAVVRYVESGGGTGTIDFTTVRPVVD
jgi:hypothetical protein